MNELEQSWREAVGEKLASASCPIDVDRSLLNVSVESSEALQELAFLKTKALRFLRDKLPDLKIRDIRFRIGRAPTQEAERVPDQDIRWKDRRSQYAGKLRDPRWQKLRLEVMQRDDWSCQICRDKTKTLNVHHRWYEPSQEPWEATSEQLVTLCEDCHEKESKGRHYYEALFLDILKKKVFHTDIAKLCVAFQGMSLGDVEQVCEAFFLLPDRALLEAYKAHRAELDSGPCPRIEISVQEREVSARRIAAMQMIVDRMEAEFLK